MPGSTFGTVFRITTWGESHGKGIGVVIDGCPAGLPLDRKAGAGISEPEKAGAEPLYDASARRAIWWRSSQASSRERPPGRPFP